MNVADPKPAPQSRYRVHIFIDFWNYELSMRETDDEFRTDWRALPLILAKESVSLLDSRAAEEYQGTNLYGSYDDRGDRDKGLKHWMLNTLDTFPGIKVSLSARQKKATGPKCPSCYEIIEKCPSCGADMRGTEEKGVDTRIATDMISLAWEDSYDIAVLVSADRDFVPVAEFLQTKGLKVIHGAFQPKGYHLTQKCWGSINIPSIRDKFRRKPI